MKIYIYLISIVFLLVVIVGFIQEELFYYGLHSNSFRPSPNPLPLDIEIVDYGRIIYITDGHNNTLMTTHHNLHNLDMEANKPEKNINEILKYGYNDNEFIVLYSDSTDNEYYVKFNKINYTKDSSLTYIHYLFYQNIMIDKTDIVFTDFKWIEMNEASWLWWVKISTYFMVILILSIISLFFAKVYNDIVKLIKKRRTKQIV